MKCDVCDRPAGSTLGRCGEREDDAYPLGTLAVCPDCRLSVCPDCLHEADCCFRDADDHADDPAWAPPGWRPMDANTWERIP